MSQMHVIATAGHVDHGKSTLVQTLTGSDPDRLEVEHERGLTIELGYCWTDLGAAGTVAFVDVPGHERFISTMLAGIGFVPACLFIVAADDPWMPQAAEHLAALDALNVQHAVVAVTRCDLADPGAAMQRVRHVFAETTLAGSPVVAVSAVTGDGLDELRGHLAAMIRDLPQPDPSADIRLWADRRFTIKGAGTVITGTLGAGTIRAGDEFDTTAGRVRVRGIQALNTDRTSVAGTARIALNLSGDIESLTRGDVLWSPDVWLTTATVDVRLRGQAGPLPARPVLHIGAASLTVRARPLGEQHARLNLDQALPLRPGDRAILRDPGDRRLWGAVVLDPLPPDLTRRGAGAARAEQLAVVPARPDITSEIERRGIVSSGLLRQLGIDTSARDYHMSSALRDRLRAQAPAIVEAHHDPRDPGMPVDVLAARLGLPASELVHEIVVPPLTVKQSRVYAGIDTQLPHRISQALDTLGARFARAPFDAPTAGDVRELGLSGKDLGAAARAGRIIQPEPGIVLPADAAERASELLERLPQPFTTSQARQALGTSRRVAIPLLDYLDRERITKRLPDDRRMLRTAAP